MSDQYSTPGSQSLTPFWGKRSRSVSEAAETATSNDGCEDSGRYKRAKTPEISGTGVGDFEENVPGLVDSGRQPRLSFGAHDPFCNDGSLGVAETFGNQFWGSVSGEIQADSLGFPSSYGVDQNNQWAGPWPSSMDAQNTTTGLPGVRSTFPEYSFYEHSEPEYAASSTQGHEDLQTMSPGITSGQGGGDLTDLDLIADLTQDGIKPHGPLYDSDPMSLEQMTINSVMKDEPLSVQSLPRVEIVASLESPRAEDAEYDTCFGVVGTSLDKGSFLQRPS